MIKISILISGLCVSSKITINAIFIPNLIQAISNLSLPENSYNSTFSDFQSYYYYAILISTEHSPFFFRKPAIYYALFLFCFLLIQTADLILFKLVFHISYFHFHFRGAFPLMLLFPSWKPISHEPFSKDTFKISLHSI